MNTPKGKIKEFENWQKQWDSLRDKLSLVKKLFHDFHEVHDSKEVNGDLKSKPIKLPRKDLQLQLTLYR